MRCQHPRTLKLDASGAVAHTQLERGDAGLIVTSDTNVYVCSNGTRVNDCIASRRPGLTRHHQTHVRNAWRGGVEHEVEVCTCESDRRRRRRQGDKAKRTPKNVWRPYRRNAKRDGVKRRINRSTLNEGFSRSRVEQHCFPRGRIVMLSQRNVGGDRDVGGRHARTVCDRHRRRNTQEERRPTQQHGGGGCRSLCLGTVSTERADDQRARRRRHRTRI